MSNEAIAPAETSTGDTLRSITAAQGSEFHEGLRSLINRCSLENGCGLPDHVIADYLANCFIALCNTRSPNRNPPGWMQGEEGRPGAAASATYYKELP